MNKSSPIGVFDSGLGGISVLASLKKVMPNENYIFYGDSKNNPYGTKSKEEITQRCIEICDHLIDEGAKAIVIACNTATSACVPVLRKRYDIDIIGMEPALKVAAEKEHADNIAVWATEFTLKEEKFARLMSRFSNTHSIQKVACPKLVRLVEEDDLDDLNKTKAALEEYIEKSGPEALDSIVLGCTHFVFFKDKLKKCLNEGVSVTDGNFGTAKHVKDLLEQKDLLNDNGGQISFENSMTEQIELSKRLYSRMEEQLS